MNMTPFNWGLVAAAVVAIILINLPWQAILAWLTTPRSTAPPPIGTPAPKAGVPTRRQVLDYADAIYTYFEDDDCKEGMAAIEIVVKHAFHEHDTEGHPTTTGGK